MVSAYIALYLFFAGAGGGAFLMGSAVDLVLRFRPDAGRGAFARVSAVTDPGLVLGPILVLIGAVFLVLDLGVPDKALILFSSSTPSLLSMGAWAIAAFVISAFLALVLGVMAGDGEETPWTADEAPGSVRAFLRVAEFVCSLVATALALFIVGYAGGFLSMYPSLPFLNTFWVPLLFVASAFTTGEAALIVTAFFRQNTPGVHDGARLLTSIDIGLIVVEVAMLAGLLLSSLWEGGAGATAALSLIGGNLALTFWLGVVIIGLLAPLSVDVVGRATAVPTVVAFGGACTLVGGLLLRIVLLMATQRFNLVFMSVLPFWN